MIKIILPVLAVCFLLPQDACAQTDCSDSFTAQMIHSSDLKKTGTFCFTNGRVTAAKFTEIYSSERYARTRYDEAKEHPEIYTDVTLNGTTVTLTDTKPEVDDMPRAYVEWKYRKSTY